MSMAQTRNKFSRKTLGVALAAGVSFGGVAVPQMSGVEGVTAVASAETRTISPTSPFPEVKETMIDREYKFSDADPRSRTTMRVLVSPADIENLSLIHISDPTRPVCSSSMTSSA